MDELIAWIEAATGPDRGLDARLCIALGLSRGNVMVGVDGWCINSETNPNPYKSPAYTASIDAALTLVPEGWMWGIGSEDDYGGQPWAWVLKPGMSWDEAKNRHAPTPALAIVIAVLKARGDV